MGVKGCNGIIYYSITTMVRMIFLRWRFVFWRKLMWWRVNFSSPISIYLIKSVKCWKLLIISQIMAYPCVYLLVCNRCLPTVVWATHIFVTKSLSVSISAWLPSILHWQVTTCDHNQIPLGNPDYQKQFFWISDAWSVLKLTFDDVVVRGGFGSAMAKFELSKHNDMKITFIDLRLNTLREKQNKSNKTI